MKRNKYTRVREGKFLFTIPEINHFLDQIDTTGPCWLWTGCKNKLGYGSIGIRGINLMCHVVSYLVHHGPIPDGLDVCHSCDNPQCVNPEHLWAGTHWENMIDRENKGRGRKPGMGTHGMWGEQIATAKLTAEKVLLIRKLYAKGESLCSISKTFGVCVANVHKIARNKTWKKLST